MQLGKLQPAVAQMRELGAEVFAISNDRVEDARRMATELGLGFRVLSNPSMDVIYRYRMKGEHMPMADMGYVLIDRAGRIVAQRIDRQFGEHPDEILAKLRRGAQATTEAR